MRDFGNLRWSRRCLINVGNARVIHPTTSMLSIAVKPYIAVNEM